MNWQTIHKTQLSLLLRTIYKKNIKDLIFKGWTSMLFFLELWRFSVDLDFELKFNKGENKEEKKQKLFSDIEKILIDNNFTIKKSHIKRYTIFFLISYGDNSKNIKVEISTRDIIEPKYTTYNFYGSIVPVVDRQIQIAFKIVALCTRQQPRDLFDIKHYIQQQIFPNPKEVEIIYKTITGKYKTYNKIIEEAKNTITQQFNNKNIMTWLWELLYDEKQKYDIKTNFLDEAKIIFDSIM